MIREYGIDAHLLMEKYPVKSQDPLHFESSLTKIFVLGENGLIHT